MRLAPDAIATLTRALARTDAIFPAADKASPLEEPPEIAPDRRPLWFVSLLYALLAIELTVLVTGLDRPTRWSLARLGVLSGDQLGLCDRLDRWSDRCSYAVRGTQLSLDDVATRLSMPTDRLAATNPSLPISGALPFYTSIVVDRSR